VRDVTERIRQKLEVDKSEFKQWNFFKIIGKDKKRSLSETDIVTSSDYSRTDKAPYYFGLEHKKPIKRENKSHNALGVKFYNTQGDDQ